VDDKNTLAKTGKTCRIGHVACMEDSRWPKRITTWSPEGRRRGRLEVKWEKEVEKGVKQRNITSGDAINRQHSD
jgi:hypothetical protein